MMPSDESPSHIARNAFQMPIGGTEQPKVMTREVQEQVDRSMGIMRENMAALAVREVQMTTLVDKSERLHNTSEVFNRSAYRLQKKTCSWQLFVGVLCGFAAIWLTISYAYRHELSKLLPVSVPLLAAGLLIARCVQLREQRLDEEDALDRERLLAV
eukprot:gnl/MRDRNA2_/MRDRNA2_34734_c0_seq1.p1 gnl/MRDRNA2_/MRDRNA2_34734_c0~~gnl/MRDRNA2_/MRDRNA2_34734_c0_seq1.p1  ORF type:complete len:157 (+),score=26.37 gnl/MRDRNA2_/MRDRNA2_34734_c0_seq1:86-556(+)